MNGKNKRKKRREEKRLGIDGSVRQNGREQDETRRDETRDVWETKTSLGTVQSTQLAFRPAGAHIYYYVI